MIGTGEDATDNSVRGKHSCVESSKALSRIAEDAYKESYPKPLESSDERRSTRRRTSKSSSSKESPSLPVHDSSLSENRLNTSPVSPRSRAEISPCVKKTNSVSSGDRPVTIAGSPKAPRKHHTSPRPMAKSWAQIPNGKLSDATLIEPVIEPRISSAPDALCNDTNSLTNSSSSLPKSITPSISKANSSSKSRRSSRTSSKVYNGDIQDSLIDEKDNSNDSSQAFRSSEQRSIHSNGERITSLVGEAFDANGNQTKLQLRRAKHVPPPPPRRSQSKEGRLKATKTDSLKTEGTARSYSHVPQGAEQPRDIASIENPPDSLTNTRRTRDESTPLPISAPNDADENMSFQDHSSWRAFERNKRRHRYRIVCFVSLFVLLMVLFGAIVIVTGGQSSESSREGQSTVPSIGPSQLFSETPTISITGSGTRERAPCFKASALELDGQTITGNIDAPGSNMTQRSFHRWCATGSMNYPISFGPSVYYKFVGNGLFATIRFCGDSRYRLNVYDSCTSGPRAYYDESCVLSVSAFALECETISFDALLGKDYFILVSTSASNASDEVLGDYEITLSSNDSCERSLDLPIDGASQSAFAPDLEGFSQGCDSATQLGAWYSVLGNGESFTFDTCQSNLSSGTQLTVYRSGCRESQQCVATSEPGYACPEQGSVSWVSEPNERYYIHAYGSGGVFDLSASRSMPYDLCEGAFSLGTETTESYQGNTSSATVSSDAAVLLSSNLSCLNYNGSPGVWYTIGGANFINVDTCDNAGGGFEPQITLLRGSCEDLSCVDFSASKPCSSGSGTQILWNLVPGETYLLFVHGNSAEETGSFTLTVTTF